MQIFFLFFLEMSVSGFSCLNLRNFRTRCEARMRSRLLPWGCSRSAFSLVTGNLSSPPEALILKHALPVSPSPRGQELTLPPGLHCPPEPVQPLVGTAYLQYKPSGFTTVMVSYRLPSPNRLEAPGGGASAFTFKFPVPGTRPKPDEH